MTDSFKWHLSEFKILFNFKLPPRPGASLLFLRAFETSCKYRREAANSELIFLSSPYAHWL